MASGERQLLVKILGNAEGAKKAMGETGDSAGGLSDHMKHLGEAVAGAVAVGAVVEFGKKCVEKFSEVAQETRQLQIVTGDTAEHMSALKFAADESGVGFTELKDALLKMSKAAFAAKDGGASLGLSFKDANGHMRDSNDILMQVADKFHNMPDGVEKSAEAAKLFGRSVGPDFIAMLDKGRAGIGDLQVEAKKFGLVIGQDGVDAAQKNVEAHRKMHAAWEGLQVMIGEKLMPVVSQITTWFAEKLPGALAWVKEKIAQLNPLFQELHKFVTAIYDYFEAHPNTLKAVGIAFGVIAAAVVLMSSPLLAVAAAAFGVYEAFKHWDKIKEAIPGILKHLEEIAGKVWAWIEEQAPIIAHKLEAWAKELWAWIQPQIMPALRELGRLLEALGDWVWTVALPFIGEKLAALGEALWHWIQPQIVPLLGELVHLLAALGNWLLDTALPFIGEKLEEWGKAFWAWIGPKIVPMLAELGKLLLKLGDWLLTVALPEILKKLGQWALALIEWVGPQIPPLLLELGKLLLKLGDWLLTTALPAILLQLGQWALAFIQWVAPAALNLLVELGKLYLKLLDWIYLTALPAILLKLGEWALAFVGWVAGVVVALPGKLADVAAALIGWIGGAVVDILVKIGGWADAFLGWIVGVVTSLPSHLASIGSAVLEWIGGVIGTIASKFVGVAAAIGSGILDGIKGAWNAVADFWDAHVAGIGFTVPSWIPGIGGDSIRVPGLPHLAAGGEITRAGLVRVGELGAETVALPAGAAVYPHGTGPRGSGDTYNITLQVGGNVVTEHQLVDAVYDGFLRKKQLVGALGLA